MLQRERAPFDVADIERLESRLRQHSSRILHEAKIPLADAEDLLQETFVALCFKWDKIQKPEAWFLATLRTRCSYYWRLQREREEAEAEAAPLDSVVAPPQAVAEVRYDFQRVYSDLPQRQRQVVQLRYRGLRNNEVAEQLGLEPEEARHLTNTTLASLTRALHRAGMVF